MTRRNEHEILYRGEDVLTRLAQTQITICGAGAVGSNIAEGLARLGAQKMSLIDDDRVDEHNLPTQAYAESDVGAYKVEAMKNRLFRTVGCELIAVRRRLDADNARKLLKEADLVIDGFDNSVSRRAVQDAVRASGTKCLHVGLSADYAEVIWDERYRVPSDVAGDVCDYPLARSTVMLAATVACESVLRSLGGEYIDWSVTLKDFAIRRMTEV